MTPFNPAIVACHAGQAARAELDAYLANEAVDLRRGEAVLRGKTLADLAELADDLRCALLAGADHYDELERADLGALQNVAKLLRSAGRP